MKTKATSALLLTISSALLGGCSIPLANQTANLSSTGSQTGTSPLHGFVGPEEVPPKPSGQTSNSGNGNSSQPATYGKSNRPAKPPTDAAKQDALPLTSYAELDNLEQASPVNFPGAYTRILVSATLPETPKAATEESSTDSNANTGAMIYRERGYIARYVFGDKYDLSLSAKVEINGYKETIPLATLSRVSNKEGQIWLRDLTSSLSGFPWFLVKKSADETNAPRVSVEFNGSRTYESGIAGTALQVAVNGIKMVSPEAGVVTTLSSSATTAKATAIDQALSILFSSKLRERYVNDRKFSTWRPDGGLEVTLNLPKEDGDWNGDLAQVGKWKVGFDAPRPSVFSDWYLCDPLPTKGSGRCKKTFREATQEVSKEKDAASILVFQLVKTTAGGVSIRDYLQQQAWFTNAATSFSGNADTNARAAGTVCTMVADTVLKLGLNNFDAAMVVWAVINGVPSMPTPENAAWQTRSCKDLLGKVSST